MRPGDHLVYLADPLAFGVLELVGVAGDGTLWCKQLTTGDVKVLQPHDVDLSPEPYVPAEERHVA